jgi:DNA-binding MarR family transcriptional regulator
MSTHISESHRNENTLELRRSAALFDAARAVAIGELEHFQHAIHRLKIYSKDQAAFTCAGVAVLLTYINAPFTAGGLRSALVGAHVCSDGRAGAMVANMRRSGDLYPSPHSKMKGRAVELTVSKDLEQFLRTRMRVEIEAMALMSPIARASLPFLDTDPQIINRAIIHVGSQLFAALEHFGANSNVANFFAQRDFGILLLAQIIIGSQNSLRGEAFAFSLSDAAKKLGISRSHVRKIVADAQDAGFVEWRPTERLIRLRNVFVNALLDHHSIRFELLAEALAQDARLANERLTA